MPNKAVVIGLIAAIAVVGGVAAYLYLTSGWEEIEIENDDTPSKIKAEWNEKKGQFRFTALITGFEGWEFPDNSFNSSKKSVTISEDDLLGGEDEISFTLLTSEYDWDYLVYADRSIGTVR